MHMQCYACNETKFFPNWDLFAICDECKAGAYVEPRAITLAPNGKQKVAVELVGRDGNSFAILGRCQSAMQRADWPQEDIKTFLDKAMSGDYGNLLAVVMEYCDDASADKDIEWSKVDDRFVYSSEEF